MDNKYGSTTKEDRKTTEEFAEMYGRPYSIVFTGTIEEYWRLLDMVGCVISGRMHSMILAMQKGCRCVEKEIKVVFNSKEQADGFRGMCFSWK